MSENYTMADFEGLFKNLEVGCHGPPLMKCQVRDATEENIHDYLLDVDECLQ